MRTKATISTSFNLLRLLSWKSAISLILSVIASTPMIMLSLGCRLIELGFLFPLSIFVLSISASLFAEYWPSSNSCIIWVLAVLAGVGMWSLLGVVTATFYAKLKETSAISALRKLRRLMHEMPKGDLLPRFLAEDLCRAKEQKNSKDTEFLRSTIHELAKPNRQAIRQVKLATEQLDNLLALFASFRHSLWLNFYGTQIAIILSTYLVTLISFGLLYHAVSHQDAAAFSPPDELGMLEAIYLSLLAAVTMGGGDLHPQANIVKWAYLLEMATTFLSLTIFLGIGITVFQTASGEDLGTVGPAILRNKRRAIRRLLLSILKSFPNTRFEQPQIPEQIMKQLKEIHGRLQFVEAAPVILAMVLVRLCDGKTAPQLGPDEIKIVMASLDNEHPVVRATGARCLGAIKATAAVQRLTALLQDVDADVRQAATDALAAIRTPGTTSGESTITPGEPV